MTPGQWVILGLLVLGVAVALQVYFRPKGRRPLSRMGNAGPQIQKEIGSEATDLGMVRAVNAENDALAQKTGATGDDYSWTEAKSAKHRLTDKH